MISIRKRLGSAMLCIPLLSVSAMAAAAQTFDARLDTNIPPTAPHNHSDFGAGVMSFGDQSVAKLGVNAPSSFQDGRDQGADGNDSFLVLQARQDGSAESPSVHSNPYEVSAVSEPSSFALAAAGLAIIGFVAAKRRRS